MMATLKTSSLDELRKMTEEAQESAAKTVKLPLGLTFQTLVACISEAPLSSFYAHFSTSGYNSIFGLQFREGGAYLTRRVNQKLDRSRLVYILD